MKIEYKPSRVPFECKTEFKATEDSNIVIGYASIFGNVDSYGDIVVQGAFKKTLKERVNKDIRKSLVPFVEDHDWAIKSVLGTITKGTEDSTGLEFEAALSEAPSIQDAKIKMIEGHVHQASFSFRTIGQRTPDKADGGKYPPIAGGQPVGRYLTELMLLDIAPVVIAANERAHITSVKSLVEQMQLGEIDEKELTGMVKYMMKLSRAEYVRAKKIISDILQKADEPDEDTADSDAAEPGNPLTDAKLVTDAQALELEISLANFKLDN